MAKPAVSEEEVEVKPKKPIVKIILALVGLVVLISGTMIGTLYLAGFFKPPPSTEKSADEEGGPDKQSAEADKGKKPDAKPAEADKGKKPDAKPAEADKGKNLTPRLTPRLTPNLALKNLARNRPAALALITPITS